MKKSIKMNIRNAVLYTEGCINLGRNGFFLDTEFGKIGVEVNPFKEMDPFHPVLIVEWEQSPMTSWAADKKNSNADYYVGINIFEKRALDHMAIIEAMSRVMLYHTGITEPDDRVINALIWAYMNNYDQNKLTINSMMAEYVTIHIGLMARNMLSVQSVVRELFQQRLDSANDIIEVGAELLLSYNKQEDTEFIDKYSEEVFGIFLYINMITKRNTETILQNVVGFKTTTENQKINMLGKVVNK